MISEINLTELEFDLYTRNILIKKMIESIRNENTPFRILDVGGRAGKLKYFLPDDEIHILDIRKGEEIDYVLGNIKAAPYQSNSFDIVISSDVYEHIPENDRLDVISEMFRISSNYVILGAPFYSEAVNDAEINACNYYREIVGEPHPWLREHIENGLPSKDKLETFLKKSGFDFVKIGTNNISNWLLLQLYTFYAYKYGIAPENVSEVNQFYNENFSELGDLCEPTYRTIYLMVKEGPLPQTDFASYSMPDILKQNALETSVFKTIGMSTDSKNTHITNLEAIIDNKKETEALFDSKLREIEDKDNHINNLEAIIDSNQRNIEDRDRKIASLETRIETKRRELNSVHSSLVWSSLQKYQQLVDRRLPHSTRRRHFYDLGLASLRLISRNGIRAFIYKVWERFNDQHFDSSNIPLLETSIGSQNIPLSLEKTLSGQFTSPVDDFDEIRILTATYNRKNSDLELQLLNDDKQIVRNVTVKGYKIKDNSFTPFKFKPIKNSKDQTFSFKLVSKGNPGAAVWYTESESSVKLQLEQDNEILNGSIGFQIFTGNAIKSKYDFWIIKNEPGNFELDQYKKESQEFKYQPLISIVVPVYNPDVAWIRDAIESVRKQVYENWELCIADASTKIEVVEYLKHYSEMDPRIRVKFLTENKGISGNSNEALALATGEFIGLLDHDDEISPDALYEVVKYLQTNPNTDMIYSDEDKIDVKGKRSNPFFKPDWSPDMLFSCMYTCHFGVYRKKIIDEIGGFRAGYDGAQDYDLVLRFIEETKRIHHIPKILYHWRTTATSTASDINSKKYASTSGIKALKDYMHRNSIPGEVLDGTWPTAYYMKRDVIGNPLVSIIVPTKDKVDLLKGCVDSILQKTKYKNYEIIIVSNNSVEEATFSYFDSLADTENVKILYYNEVFNFSGINNFAVEKVEGDFVLFLNNDTEVISGDWLEAMLQHAQREEVGAVGAKLLYSNNTVQHAGVILGITGTPGEKGVAGHSHKYLPGNDIGYFGRVGIVHDLSAVTAACLMMRKEVFVEIDGFNEENLAVAFNDVDLCLKIRDKGYLIVYTPYAKLYHHESISRGFEDTPEKQERFLKEVAYMRQKWGRLIDEGDPYYSPNLTLEKEDFSIRI
jgi:GT2 family glycosyltransferase